MLKISKFVLCLIRGEKLKYYISTNSTCTSSFPFVLKCWFFLFKKFSTLPFFYYEVAHAISKQFVNYSHKCRSGLVCLLAIGQLNFLMMFSSNISIASGVQKISCQLLLRLEILTLHHLSLLTLNHFYRDAKLNNSYTAREKCFMFVSLQIPFSTNVVFL
jgi:hypothetical protein